MKPNLFLILCILSGIFIQNCAGDNVKKSVDENRDDNGETNDETNESLQLQAPYESESNNTICTRRQNSQVHEIRLAQPKQFPFMVAIMSVSNEFICSGAVISNGLILTTAQCTQQPVSYVLINATKAKRDNTTVTLHIIKTEKFPTDKDVGLIYTEKHNSSIASKIRLSNYTSSRNVVNIEALGFGLNSEVGQTKQLQFIGLDNDIPIKHLDTSDLIRGYFGCIDSKDLTCFKDTGGPSIFDNELVGIVIKGQDECTKEITASYAGYKKIVEAIPTYTFKAWLDEKIKKNEEQEKVSLATFPMKPSRRREPVQMKHNSGRISLEAMSYFKIVGLILFKMLF